MRDFLMVEDSELWDIILDGPHVPTLEVKDGESTQIVPKTRQQYIDEDGKKTEKNYKDKKFLLCGIGAKEYN